MKKYSTMLSTRNVAHILNVSENTVRDFNASAFKGFPKGIKVRGQWRWHSGDILKWIASLRNEKSSTRVNTAPAEEIIFASTILGATASTGQGRLDRLFSNAENMLQLLKGTADPTKICRRKDIIKLINLIEKGAD